MAFGLYQRWFRRPNKDFCEKSFFERYGSIVLQQQWEDTIKVSVFYVFFFKKHLQGTTIYLGISKIWSIQLILFDFVIMQCWHHHNVIFCYEMRKIMLSFEDMWHTKI